MLSHAQLSKIFQGEAMRVTIDIVNLSPSHTLEKHTRTRVGEKRCQLQANDEDFRC